MSYTVNIPATHSDNGVHRFGVTTYHGGARGRMLQITIGDKYASLTMDQLDYLLGVLNYAREGSLADHPHEGDEE